MNLAEEINTIKWDKHTTTKNMNPSYWAAVSGGKDSSYMLGQLFNFSNAYPLDGVYHINRKWEYPFIKDALNLIEEACNNRGIPFVKLEPPVSWEEYYEKYGYPTQFARWCRKTSDREALKKLKAYLNTQGKYLVSYRGIWPFEQGKFVQTEFKSKISKHKNERYPLIDMHCSDVTVLNQAREMDIYNDFYIFNFTHHCIDCPLSRVLEQAYQMVYYPDLFKQLITLEAESDKKNIEKIGRELDNWHSFRAEKRFEHLKKKHIIKLFGEMFKFKDEEYVDKKIEEYNKTYNDNICRDFIGYVFRE